VAGNDFELLRLEINAERRHIEKYGSEIRRAQHLTHRSDHRVSRRDEKRVCNLQCRYQTHHKIPQVRHHRQHGRIDVDFLCSCSATEPIVLFLELPLRQIRKILTHETDSPFYRLWFCTAILTSVKPRCKSDISSNKSVSVGCTAPDLFRQYVFNGG
jgi:hypothetical protein